MSIDLFNKYELKANFKINSSLLGFPGKFECNDKSVSRNKVAIKDIRQVCLGHEISVHTLTHPNLTQLDEETIVYQVEEDRKRLFELAGYEVIGMAYPFGRVNNDDRVAKIIKTQTGVKYARTISSTNNFEPQSNLLRFNPSVHYIAPNFEELVDAFLNLQADTPQLLYIGGHSYEMDGCLIAWNRFEKICQKLSGKWMFFMVRIGRCYYKLR